VDISPPPLSDPTTDCGSDPSSKTIAPPPPRLPTSRAPPPSTDISLLNWGWSPLVHASARQYMHMEAMRRPITPRTTSSTIVRIVRSGGANAPALDGCSHPHPLLRAAAGHTACAPRALGCVPRCGNPPEIVKARQSSFVAEGTQVVPEERRITPFAPAACVLWIERVHVLPYPGSAVAGPLSCCQLRCRPRAQEAPSPGPQGARPVP